MIKSLITIDGPSGSGKTTLAAQIHDSLSSDGFDVATIHMDNLYDGWGKALDSSLSQILQKIIDDFFNSPRISIPQYDWQRSRYSAPIAITSPSHLILEGVGSGQQVTRPWANTKLWVEAPLDLALQRVLTRDGIQIREKMQQWQLREAEHFLLEGTKSAADYIVKSAP